ncbi:MAG: hypothetical protein ACRCT1_14130 [Microcoleaceae cyanobacterium]
MPKFISEGRREKEEGRRKLPYYRFPITDYRLPIPKFSSQKLLVELK